MGSLFFLTGLFSVIFVSFIVAFFAWFFPWVFALPLGILIYFPYEPNGQDRYLRATGPLSFSDEWVAAEHVPRACKAALVAAEDTRFYNHFGVDFDSLEKSYEFNQRKKKIRRGGSTITQQLVKNAFLSRDRSYIRKGREIIGALMLDAVMSKDNQLIWYFNIVEFGPRVYGVQAAARHYFKKDAKSLSPSECISLVAVLPSPNRWNSSLSNKNKPSSFFKKRYSTILARMQVMNLASSAELSAARKAALYTSSVPLPSKESLDEPLPPPPESELSPAGQANSPGASFPDFEAPLPDSPLKGDSSANPRTHPPSATGNQPSTGVGTGANPQEAGTEGAAAQPPSTDLPLPEAPQPGLQGGAPEMISP